MSCCFVCILFLLVFPLRVSLRKSFSNLLTIALHVHITHIHIHIWYTHTVQPLFLVWRDCGCPPLVKQSDYCSHSVCALAVMWSLWRLTIVWPKNIFVVAQPLRTSLGQSPDLRVTQHTGEKILPIRPHLLFNVLCLSDSKVVLVWWFFLCFASPFITDILFPPLQIDKDVEKKRKKKEMIITFWKKKLFIWVACWNADSTSASKTMNCTLL